MEDLAFHERIEQRREEKILRLLQIIDTYIAHFGISPTFRDVANAMKYKSLCQPRYFIQLAQRRGYVHYRVRANRTLQLTDLGRAVLGYLPGEGEPLQKAA